MVGSRLKQLLEAKKISGKNFAEIMEISEAKASRWINGKSEVPFEDLIKITQQIGGSIDFLLGIIPNKEGWKSVPILDKIPDGDPRELKKFHKTEISFPADLAGPYDFGILMPDDSMRGAGILFLDILFVKYEAEPESGAIFAYLLKETLKVGRMFIGDQHIILKPENNNFAPVCVNPKTNEFRLLGKITGLLRPDTEL